MRWSSGVALLLLLAGPAHAGGGTARRHLTPSERADCPRPWCQQAPTLCRLEAPGDPSLYLGDVISYERPSDWRSFPPLRERVEALTAGRTSARDKVAALADWIKHAKVPAAHGYTTWPASIIDMWGFPEVQCEEASFLLVAMLRLAGIPAMRFSTWSNGHTAARAYVDGQWCVADATPTTPDNSAAAPVYAPDDPAVIPAYQERPLLELAEVPVPGRPERVASFTLFSQEPVNESAKLAVLGLAYGRVAFPVTNEFLYYDRETRRFVEAGRPDQRVGIRFRIEAADAPCLDAAQSSYAYPIGFALPELRWRTIDDTLPPSVGLFYPLGYIETILPTCGTWRVVYSLSAEDLDAASSALAYAEVELADATDFAVVRPGQLRPAEGADGYCFRTLVDTLDRLPTFEQLGGTVAR